MISIDGNLRLILGHLASTIIIELGLGLVASLGHLVVAEGIVRTILIASDEWAMLGVSLMLIRNLAVNLWNNRERLGGPNVVLA